MRSSEIAPAMTFPRFLTVGFVGARRLSPADGEQEDLARREQLRDRLEEILRDLQAELRPGESLAAVSALAAGADTVFGEVMADRGITQLVLLPQTPDFFFQASDFFGSPDRIERAKALLQGKNVIDVRVVSNSTQRRARFSDCGYGIVHECDILIAALPEGEEIKEGGTLETLRYAESHQRRIFRITLADGLPLARPAPRKETAAEPDDVFGWPLDYRPDAATGPHDAILALKAVASARARRHKVYFHYVTGFVLVTHLTATAIAVWVLAGFLHGDGAKMVKGLLLLAGMGVYFYVHHRKPQRDWVNARLVAELCRSVIAWRGFPARLGYLREFHMPGCRQLVHALELLHLQSARNSPVAATDFADRYLKERIGGMSDTGSGAQIEHFRARSAAALRTRLLLEAAFYFFTLVALVCVAASAGSGPGEPQWSAWQRFAYEVVPIMFPFIAAAAASWVSILDLDRRAELYQSMIGFLEQQRHHIDSARRNPSILASAVRRTEHGLLQEVVEWHAKHVHLRGG